MKQIVSRMMLVAVLSTSTVALGDGSNKEAGYFTVSSEDPVSLDGSNKEAGYFWSQVWELLVSFTGTRT